MTAIVLNTFTGAVSEYDWTFKSIAANHAANDTALLALGGDNDAGVPIDAELRGGRNGGAQVMGVGDVFLALQGTGTGTLVVQGRTAEWEYPLAARASGVSVAKPGLGIRESYLGFGYKNAAGAAFQLDRIDAEVFVSKNRRS